jgi:hypothetical protein
MEGWQGFQGDNGFQGFQGVGSGATGYYLEAFDTTDQSNAGNTAANLVTYNSIGINRGIGITGTGSVIFFQPGDFTLAYSIQIYNDDSQDQTVDIWISKNGTNVPDSNSRFTILKKTALIASTTLILRVNTNDIIELYWSSPSLFVGLEHFPPSTNPIRPAIPSVILVVDEISGTVNEGVQGRQGIHGSQGYQGFQGLQGYQGLQGLQGYAGIQGYQGLQGHQGLQGPLQVITSYSMTLASDSFTSNTTEWFYKTIDWTTIANAYSATTFNDWNWVSGPLLLCPSSGWYTFSVWVEYVDSSALFTFGMDVNGKKRFGSAAAGIGVTGLNGDIPTSSCSFSGCAYFSQNDVVSFGVCCSYTNDNLGITNANMIYLEIVKVPSS